MSQFESAQGITSQAAVVSFHVYPVEQASHTPFVQITQFGSTQGITSHTAFASCHIYPVEQTSHIPPAQDSQLSK